MESYASTIRKYVIVIGSLALLIACVLVMIVLGSIPTSDFPVGHTINIDKGSSLSSTADKLSTKGIIRSPFIFKVYSLILGGNIKAGGYRFNSPQSALRIASRLTSAEFGLHHVKI